MREIKIFWRITVYPAWNETLVSTMLMSHYDNSYVTWWLANFTRLWQRRLVHQLLDTENDLNFLCPCLKVLRVRANLTPGRMSLVSCAADWSLESELLGIREFSDIIMEFIIQFGVLLIAYKKVSVFVIIRNLQIHKSKDLCRLLTRSLVPSSSNTANRALWQSDKSVFRLLWSTSKNWTPTAKLCFPPNPCNFDGVGIQDTSSNRECVCI